MDANVTAETAIQNCTSRKEKTARRIAKQKDYLEKKAQILSLYLRDTSIPNIAQTLSVPQESVYHMIQENNWMEIKRTVEEKVTAAIAEKAARHQLMSVDHMLQMSETFSIEAKDAEIKSAEAASREAREWLRLAMETQGMLDVKDGKVGGTVYNITNILAIGARKAREIEDRANAINIAPEGQNA